MKFPLKLNPRLAVTHPKNPPVISFRTDLPTRFLSNFPEIEQIDFNNDVC